MFDREKMEAYKAFQCDFNKFSQSVSHEVFGNLYQWFFSNLQFVTDTLDLDPSVITRYREWKGAVKGYNPGESGRKSHHLLIAFVADCRMIVNCWDRPDNYFRIQ